MECDLCAEETLVLYRLLKHVALAWKYRIWTISSSSRLLAFVLENMFIRSNMIMVNVKAMLALFGWDLGASLIL
jgi:hypothetical protein